MRARRTQWRSLKAIKRSALPTPGPKETKKARPGFGPRRAGSPRRRCSPSATFAGGCRGWKARRRPPGGEEMHTAMLRRSRTGVSLRQEAHLDGSAHPGGMNTQGKSYVRFTRTKLRSSSNKLENGSNSDKSDFRLCFVGSCSIFPLTIFSECKEAQRQVYVLRWITASEG